MDMNTFMTQLANFGLPAILCIYVMYQGAEDRKAQNAQIMQLNKTIQENTNIVAQLKVLIETLVNRKGD